MRNDAGSLNVAGAPNPHRITRTGDGRKAMSKKNAIGRHTTHMAALGPLNRGKPKHGKMHIGRGKRRGPAKRK